MKQIMMMVFAIGSVSAFASMPEISATGIAQDQSRLVTVTYTLSGASAIVTMDVLTNGVSIGRRNFVNAQGDVNRLVEPGETRRITWQPHEIWPGMRFSVPTLSVRLTAHPVNLPPAYMVVSLEGDMAGSSAFYETSEELSEGIGSDVYRKSKLLLRRIPVANVPWNMGAAADGNDHDADNPLHHVALTDDFWIGVFEVTQYQFERIYGEHKGRFTAEGDTRPVETVSYFEVRANPSSTSTYFRPGAPAANSFMGKLQGLTGFDFDLPTEAQWEFACRAGTGSVYYNGTDDSQPAARIGGTSVAATTLPAVGGTARVGSYEPNGFGLYDMYGNVSEWCVDCYNLTGYGLDSLAGQSLDPCNWNNPTTDATDPNLNNKYLRRGGGYRDNVKFGRSATRYYWNTAIDSIGFRVMCHGQLVGEE